MKGKKYIVPVMLASLVGAPAAILNNSVVSSASAYDKDSNTTILGPEIQLSGYEAKKQKGEDIVVPVVSAQNLGDLKFKVTVTDPLGEETIFGEDGQEYAPFKNDGTDKVKANFAGTYTIKYEVYGTNTITTTLIDEISILVVGDEYSLDMPTNSYHVVPSEMKYTANRVVTFPVPAVFKNGESLDSLDGEIRLIVEKTGGAEVVLSSNNAQQFVAKNVASNTTGEAYFTNTFTSAGRYRYKYQYVVGGEVVDSTESKTFKLSENTTIENTVLNFSTVSDIKTSGVEVGDLVELPEVKVFEKGNSSKTFDAYTKVVVTYLGPEEVDSTAVELEKDGFSFVPKYTGNYQVEYNISIPNMNGLKVENAKKYIISGVVDNDPVDIYLTGSYDVSADGKVTKVGESTDLSEKDVDEVVEALGDMTSSVDSYYVLNNENKVTVQLPAAYVVDNHASINNITVKRELYKKGNSSNTFRIVKTDNETEETDASKVAQYTFSTTGNGVGDYVLRYYVKDDSTSGNGKYYSYYIYVRDNTTLQADWVPTISLDTNSEIPTKVEADETITFASATAVDKHDGVIYDKNLDVRTYYAFSNEDKATAEEAYALTNKVRLDENEDGKYEINIKDAADTDTYVYIITTAKNSYNDTLAYAYKKVRINRVDRDDNVKPTLKLGAVTKAEDVDTKLNGLSAALFNTQLLTENEKTVTLNTNGLTADGNGAFDQKDTIKLPAMTFMDNGEDITLSVYVTYISNDGKTVNKVDITSYDRNKVKGNDGNYYYTISNASFVADYAKMYTVTYVARDVNNMFSCTSFGVYVNDTVAPVIKVKNNSKFAESLEVGSWFNIPEATVEDNGEVAPSLKANWKVVSSGGAFQTNDNGFRPLDIGTYYVVYSATDEAGQKTTTPEKQYAVEVVATEKPVIKFVASAYDEEYDWNYEDKYVIFAVPKATAEDKLGSIVVGTPTVKDGNDQDVTMASDSEAREAFANYDNDKAKYYYYKAQSQGKYSVTYTAKRWDKLTSTTPLSIEIGDCDAPQIKWVNKEEDFSATVTVGETWQFNMNMVTIEDNLDDVIDTENITITMTDPDGTILDNGNDYTYKFEKEGKYTFKVQAKDTAGNNTYNEFSHTITVKGEEETTVNKNTVLGMSPAVGTTLIVLSVVVLGGVVVYFVLSSKNAMKSKKDRKNNK